MHRIQQIHTLIEKMLKNWTVTTQAVKNAADGIMTRERYLLASNHPNHKNTEAIVSIIGNQATSHRIALAGEAFRLHQKLHYRKGGRPLSSYAVEFCLTLPKGHRPTPQQWRAIIQDCCAALAKMLKLTPDELKQYKSQIRSVVHQQHQSGRTGSGDHAHLIVCKIVGSRVLKELQQKKATKLIKQSFNAAVLKHVGLDHREYKPHELNRGKRLETWRYQHLQAEEAVHTLKLISKLQTQADKWFKAREDYDYKQQNRQMNRLIKTFEELAEQELSTEHRREVNKLKQEIKSKSKQKLS